jgi:uncharacterized phiE125 gp8 family phage protein
MTIRWQPKRPAETRTYFHDWTPFLGVDTIASKVDVATGVTLDSVDIETGDRSVTFTVSGGTNETVGRVTQTITTAGGLVESETFILPIRLAEEPVSLSTAKAHLRVTDDSEDALIESLIVAAREWVENYTGHILVRRMVSQAFNGFDSYFELYHRPVVDVDPIAYTDGDGAPQTLADFAQTTGRYPFRVYPDEQPSTEDNSSVILTYEAGYAEGEEPQALIQAMLLLIGHWWTTRSSVTENPRHEVPMAVHSLCDQYRVPVI